MRILLIGSGGREHAIAKKLSESPSCTSLYCLPGNPGIFEFAESVALDLTKENVVEFCLDQKIDLVFVGPEQPLEQGFTDFIEASGIAVFGPTQSAARLETSKGFAKDFMQRHSIPTAKYGRFELDKFDAAKSFAASMPLPVVIKADGLAAGKGVVLAESYEEANVVISEMLGGHSFGNAGTSIVIEEFLHGEEASVFALCDESDFVLLAPAQDHKRIGDGDTGKNTGGMGSYAPAPIANQEVLNKVATKIVSPLLEGMKQDGTPFKGCLFIGLMINNNEPSVVEFNVRFGDPETQSVLEVFEGDFAQLVYSCAKKSIQKDFVTNVSVGFACTVVLASGGYPDSFEKDKSISGTDLVQSSKIYHAGTILRDGFLKTNGGRVLGITAKGETLKEAIQIAYSDVAKISFEGMYYRSDIGNKGLSL